MSITCLCIGDLHFQESNTEQVDEFTAKALQAAKELDPAFIVILGDVLHTQEKIHVTPFKRATDFIQALTEVSPTYVIIGNHDYKNSSQYLSDEHPFNALKLWPNCFIVDKVLIHEYEVTLSDDRTVPMRFGFCPYVPLSGKNGRFLDALGTENWETCECVFAHQEIKGVKMGPKTSESPDEWDASFPLLVSGHIHETQNPAQNVFYTGSAMQHSVSSDDGNKFIFQMRFSGAGEWAVQAVDLDLKRKKRIRVSIEDVETVNFNEFDNVILTVDVSGTSDQFKRFRSSKFYKDAKRKGVRFAFSPMIVPVFTSQNDEVPSEDMPRMNRKFLELLGDLLENESEVVRREYENVLKFVNE